MLAEDDLTRNLLLIVVLFTWGVNAKFLENGCPEDYSVHLLLPHETDCATFYSCSNGDKHSIPCPPTLVFNVEKQVCDWPWNVNCDRRLNSTTQPPTTTENDTVETTETISTTEESTDPTTVEIKEPTTEGSKNSTTEPTTTTEVSKYPTIEPTLTTKESKEYTTEPTTPIEENKNPTTDSTTTTEENKDSTTTTEESKDPTKESTTTTEESKEITTEPTSTTNKSQNPTTEPTTTTEENKDPTTDSTTTTEESKDPTTESTTTTEESKDPTTETTLTTERCTPITGSGCTQTTSPVSTTTEVVSTTETEQTSTPEEISTTEISTTTSESIVPRCPPGFFGNVPHPTICNSYYLCSGGMEIQLFCPTDQEFDPTMARCTPITGSGCTQTTSPVSTTTEVVSTTETEQTSTPEEISTTEISTTTSESIVPRCPPGFFGNVPHPTICNSYYLCSGGMEIQLFCPTDQEFDPTMARCTPITGSGCTQTTSPVSTTTEVVSTTETEQTSTPEEISTTEISTTTSESIVPRCPPGFFGNVPHPTICNSYYLCSGGMEIQLFCPTDTDFDPTMARCTPITGSGCTQTTSPVSTTTEVVSTTETEQTSTPEEISTTEISTTTSESIVPRCPPGFFGNVPHPTICNSYYLCSGGMEIQLFCPTDQEFDPTMARCTPITGSGCTQTTSPVSTTTEVLSTTETEQTSTPEEISTTEISTTTSESIVPRCPPGFFGNVPHPTICNSYYLCSGGMEIQLFCPTDQEFDPTMARCTPITGSGCTQTTSPVSTTTEVVSTTETEQTSTPEEISTTEISTTTSESIVPRCPPGFFGNVPHPTICNSYYLCSGGMEIQLFCPTDQEFDPTMARCTPITGSGCTQTTSPVSTTTEVVSTTETEQTSTPEEISTTEISTTTSESIVPRCPPGFFGNVPHPTICNSYYLCSGGMEIQLFCPTDQEFDPTMARCTPITGSGCTQTTSPVSTTTEVVSTTETEQTSTPEEISTTEISTTTSESIVPRCPPGFFGNVPHPTICNSYYLCSGGMEIQLFCPTDTDFDPTMARCTPITGSGCTQTTSPVSTTTEVVSTTETEQTSTPEEISTTEISTTTSESIVPRCPPGFFGNVPHPTICNSYYLCSGGMEIQLFCPTDQEFDPTMARCTSITGSGCTQTTSPVSTTTEVLSTTETEQTFTPEEISTTTSESIVPRCPPGFFGNVPHPTICNSYYLCSGGMEIQLFCPTDTEFDPTMARCTPITGSGCTQTTSPVSTTTEVVSTTETEQTSTPEEISTTEISTTTSESIVPRCPPGFFGNVPHPTICNSYYLCSGGMEIQLFCPTDTEFDPTMARCTPITGSGCTQTTSPVSTTTEVVSTTETEQTSTPEEISTTEISTTTSESIVPRCPPGFFGNVPHPTICNSYYLCSGGMEIQLFCPTDQEFDPTMARCTPITGSGCTQTTSPVSTTTEILSTTETEQTFTPEEISTTTSESIVPRCPPGFFGNVPHPTICNSYYLCSGGMEIQLFCPTDTEFDPTMARCTPITGSGCTQTTSPVSTTTEVVSTTETEQTSTPEEISTTEISTTTSESIVPRCPPGFFGNVPHPTICNSYYLCSGGMEIQLFCPTDQEFDPTMARCTPITGSGCTQTTSPVSTTTEVVSTTETEQTSTPEEISTTEISTTTSESIVPRCPPGFFGNVPHPTICNSYYLCSGGMEIQLFCPIGQEFGSTNARCTPITGNGCSQLSALQTKSDNFSLCKPGYIGYLPHKSLCDSFIKCADGIGIQLHCSNGLEFDSDVNSCVPVSTNGCNFGEKKGIFV